MYRIYTTAKSKKSKDELIILLQSKLYIQIDTFIIN